MRFAPRNLHLWAGVRNDDLNRTRGRFRFFGVKQAQLNSDLLEPQVPGRGSEPAGESRSSVSVEIHRWRDKDRKTVPL